MTTLIRLDGEIVASVGGSRIFLAPQFEALSPDDPILREVLLMGAFALECFAVEYSDEAAAARADAALALLAEGDEG